jgi:hypothetical protein
MRICCFYSDTVHANTAAAIAKYAPQTEYVDVSGDTLNYGRAILERWTGEDDLVIIEHDIEINDDVISTFDSCPSPWCTYGYDIFAPPYTVLCNFGIGCVKISAQLQRDLDFNQLVLKEPCRCHRIHQHWWEIDSRLVYVVTSDMDIQLCDHGKVGHLHPYFPVAPTGIFNITGNGIKNSDITPLAAIPEYPGQWRIIRSDVVPMRAGAGTPPLAKDGWHILPDNNRPLDKCIKQRPEDVYAAEGPQ